MDLLKFLITFLLLTVYGLSAVQVVDKLTDDATYRLPNSTYPESYVVILNFRHFDRVDSPLTFIGTVTIDIKILEETQEVVLHSSVASIEDHKLIIDGVETPSDLDSDVEREFLIIKTGSVLAKDSHVSLWISYVGNIGSAVRGVYRASFLNENSERRYFLATHMQPTYARSVFPCYDEPSFKSRFTFSINHERDTNINYHSITNMDKDGTEIERGDFIITLFKQTPLMPTYLLGFVLSDFEAFEVKQGYTYRAFSRPEQLNNTKLGVMTAIYAMALYESYFTAKYDLDKLDQVALPRFNYGGMENHGIIFYREDLFLHDDEADTVYDKELRAATVVHEVCHKFFGNTMTYHWWSFLWMSEGFCKFYEYYMTHFIYPGMRMKDLFAVEAMQYILYYDSSGDERPITYYVEKPAEIRRLFDSISYAKAASIIRMFHHALTEDKFREAIQIYLSKKTSNPEGTAKPEHFHEALRLALKNESFDVVSAFKTWELQGGYPVLFVERNYNGNNLRITQKKFTDDIKDGADHDEIWTIPITYSSKNFQISIPIVQLWLENRSVELQISGLRPNHYFLVNLDQIGYFRVMYDEPNWMEIANELWEQNFHYFSPNTRAMLIDDAGVFVETEILKLRLFLELIRYLEHETDYIPWISATNNLFYMRRMLNNGCTKTYKDFQKFLQKLFTKVFKTYGTTEQSDLEHHEKHIRNIAVNWACQAHLPDCLKQTADLLDIILKDSAFVISNDHKSTIMCNGAITADRDKYNVLWERYGSAQTEDERELMLKTIGCIEDKDILEMFIRNFDKVEDDDWLIVIQSVYANGPIGMNVALKFLDKEYEEFTKFLTERNEITVLPSIFRGIATRVVTIETFEDFTKLMEKYDLSASLKLTLTEIIEENLLWINENSPIIQQFLDDYSSAVKSTSSVLMFLVLFIVQFIAY